MYKPVYFKPKKVWILKLLPLVLWTAIYLASVSLGIADPTFPPPPPPGNGS